MRCLLFQSEVQFEGQMQIFQLEEAKVQFEDTQGSDWRLQKTLTSLIFLRMWINTQFNGGFTAIAL